MNKNTKPASPVLPLTPTEVKKGKIKYIPPEVIESFNELLLKNTKILQKDVVALICNKLNIENKQVIFDNHWLDIEDLYEQYGWAVNYNKPGYNEDYEPKFIFTVIS